MEIREIKISPLFERHYRKLPKEIKERAKRKEKIFRKNPFDPRLKTHKLHGKEKECWAFWIDYKYRIKFIFLSDEEVLFLDIGPHDIYK
jgi:mRNA-degrading endonuclease YafQ of YafQ-DinJ toxin-antitoxin module